MGREGVSGGGKWSPSNLQVTFDILISILHIFKCWPSEASSISEDMSSFIFE